MHIVGRGLCGQFDVFDQVGVVVAGSGYAFEELWIDRLGFRRRFVGAGILAADPAGSHFVVAKVFHKQEQPCVGFGRGVDSVEGANWQPSAAVTF